MRIRDLTEHQKKRLICGWIDFNEHRTEPARTKRAVQKINFIPYRIYAVRVYGAENEIYTVQNPCIPPASEEVLAGGANQNFTL